MASRALLHAAKRTTHAHSVSMLHTCPLRTSVGVSLLRCSAVHSTCVRGYKERHMIQPPFSGYKVDTTRDTSPLVSHPSPYAVRDPGPLFATPWMQQLLRRVAGCDETVVFRQRGSVLGKLETPQYVFMTDAQLAKAREDADKKAFALLQMPPIVKVREASDSDPGPVLCRDPALAEMEASIVVTDITKDVDDSQRIIVVREKDGTLRHASYGQRHRCNQIYNPRAGRNHRHPDMFHEESFAVAMEAACYERLLDRTTVHFEPNDPLYQSVVARVYDHVNEKADFQTLRSTRHFGPMTFYLAWHKNIDSLLVFFLDKLADVKLATDVVRIFACLHSDSLTYKFVEENEVTADEGEKYESFCMGALESYMVNDAKNRSALELSLKNYKEAVRAQAEFDQKVNEKLSGSG